MYFGAFFLIHRLLVVVLSFLIFQAKYLESARMLGLGLVIIDIVFFTNPLLQTSESER